MKSTSLALLLIILSSFQGYSQKVALTETGEQVIIHNDGTWEYASDTPLSSSEITTNEKKFVKDKSQSFLLKSTRTKVGMWIDGTTWSFAKGETEDVAEYNFQLKGEDLYAMLISEKMEIPLESLKAVAIENAKSVAPDLRMDQEEYRNVNGVEVLMLRMSGTIEGIKFTYFGYYYSDANGTIQLITYTGSTLFADYQKDIEKFLNGFVRL
jgi:hypothetical protein